MAFSLALLATVLAGRLRGLLKRRSFQVIAVASVHLAGAFVLKWKAADLRLPRPDHRCRHKSSEQIGAHGWVAGRYRPDQGDLLWEHRNDRLRPISAAQRFVTTDERYWLAIGTMRPRPTVFIVGEPIELVLQPDLVARSRSPVRRCEPCARSLLVADACAGPRVRFSVLQVRVCARPAGSSSASLLRGESSLETPGILSWFR
jgi:hypothetical protein